MKLHHYDPWPRAGAGGWGGPDIGPGLLSNQELGHDGSSVKTRWKMLEVQPGKIMTMLLHCIITNTQLQDSNIFHSKIFCLKETLSLLYLTNLPHYIKLISKYPHLHPWRNPPDWLVWFVWSVNVQECEVAIRTAEWLPVAIVRHLGHHIMA